jgi:hypothetical protein
MSTFRYLLSVAAFGACGAAHAAVPFDLDRDGKVSAHDINQAARILSLPLQQGGIPLPGSGAVPGDFNGDHILNLADWSALIDYVTVVHGPRMLFDTQSTGALDGYARMDILSALRAGTQSACCYQLRYDFNGDGATNLKDWKVFVNHLRLHKQAVLLDVNGDGQVTGADLDVLARTLDRPGYDLQFDLNGDGLLNAGDWKLAINVAGRDADTAKAVFDVDGAMPATLSAGDGLRISQELSAMSTGWRPSMRYDLNGDANLDVEDWSEWVQFAVHGLRAPDLVLDVDGNGVVNAIDLNRLLAGYQGRPVEHRFDVNGDQMADAGDVALLRSRLAYGGPVVALGDVNRDGCVDAVDIAAIQVGSGQSLGMPGFDPDLDVDRNNTIDMGDIYRAQGPGFGTC